MKLFFNLDINHRYVCRCYKENPILLQNKCQTYFIYRNLHYPNHGYERFLQKMKTKNARDYEAWKQGLLIPSLR